jgi:hypothetical protein
MKRKFVHAAAAIALTMLAGAAAPTSGSAAEYRVSARSGQPTALARIWKYGGQNQPSNGLGVGAFVDHGAVVFKEVMVSGDAQSVIVYTSIPGFKGVDRVVIPTGPRQLIFDVTVH